MFVREWRCSRADSARRSIGIDGARTLARVAGDVAVAVARGARTIEDEQAGLRTFAAAGGADDASGAVADRTLHGGIVVFVVGEADGAFLR